MPSACVLRRARRCADGQKWLPSRTDFLASVHALSELFRAKFRGRLLELGLSERVLAQAWTGRTSGTARPSATAAWRCVTWHLTCFA